MSDEPYRVINSAAVAEQFRALVEQARAAGRLRSVLAAARWIVEELSRTPAEFGESWTEYPRASLVFRRGFARPLFVQYAIHEAEQIVYIRRFALVRD